MEFPGQSVRPFLIGNQWRETGTCLPVINPYSGQTVAEVCQAGMTEAEEAISLAVRASPAMAQLPSHIRAGALGQVAKALLTRQEEFAHTISIESGKPIADSRREAIRAIQTFTIASEETKRLPGDIIPMDLAPGMDHHFGMLRRVPIGPVLGITPFNFPLNLVAHKVAPCLAAGNPIVIKPAPQTPLTALLLGEILMESGLPIGAVSVLPCENQVAELMVRDPRFKAFSFTGSASVGWMLKDKAGKKRVLLELGGNAAVIVEPDANIELAVHRCLTGGFSFSGQTCISVQRLYIHDQVYDPFVEKFINRVGLIACGDPLNEATVVGPLINEGAARRVEDWIQEAVSQGASVLTGGKRRGSMVDPTVMAEVRQDMKVSCEEVFGPVVTLTRYREFDQALELVNDSPFGLQAGVFTEDVNKIFRAYRKLEVGTVLANEIPTFRAEHMPYGGVKDSGLGREGVRYVIEELTEPKLLVLNLPH